MFSERDVCLVTGSTLALHCCKAHAKINRKMKHLTPCKIITPDNFILKLCTRVLCRISIMEVSIID